MKFFYHILPILLVSCFWSSCAKDEVETTGTIYGIVNDSDNGQPIQDAHVSLTPYGKTINTGSDGSYEFPQLEVGQYTIQISKSGYKTNTKRISVVAGEKASGDMILQWGTSRIKLNIASLNFGSQSTSKTFTIRNISTSGTSVSWSVSKASPAAWLNITPASGSTAFGKESVVSVNVDRNRITKDETAILLIEAEEESLSIEVSVSLRSDNSDNSGGSCGLIAPYDTKLSADFVQCTKVGSTVEFQFKITNTGDDVTLDFASTFLQGYDSEGNEYDFRNSELWLAGKHIYNGGPTSQFFPNHLSIPGRIILKNVPSGASSISRCEIVISRSYPWSTLNRKMYFEDIKW